MPRFPLRSGRPRAGRFAAFRGAHPALPRTVLERGSQSRPRPAQTPRPGLEGHPGKGSAGDKASPGGRRGSAGRHDHLQVTAAHHCPGPPGSSAAGLGGRRHFGVTSARRSSLPRAEGTRGARYGRGPGTDHVCRSDGSSGCSGSPLRRDCGRGSAAPSCRWGAGGAAARGRLGAVVVVTGGLRRSTARENCNSQSASGPARHAPARHWRLPLPPRPIH